MADNVPRVPLGEALALLRSIPNSRCTTSAEPVAWAAQEIGMDACWTELNEMCQSGWKLSSLLRNEMD